MAKTSPKVERLMRRKERIDNNRAKQLIRNVITPVAPLTKEAQKALNCSSKEKDSKAKFD